MAKIHLIMERVDLGSHVVGARLYKHNAEEEAAELNKKYDLSYGQGSSDGLFGLKKYWVMPVDVPDLKS